MLAGFPVAMALGTNKLQASIGTASATFQYYQKGLLEIEPVIKGLIYGFIGATTGTILAVHLHPLIMEKLIPLCMLAILIYIIFTPQLGIKDIHPRIQSSHFYMFFGFGLGIYDGFFGPATGTFWIFAFVFFLGFNLARASAYAKIFNLKSNLIALAWFTWFHQVHIMVGLFMALGQALGGFVGARLVISKGARFVRPFYISAVSLMITSLFYHHYF